MRENDAALADIAAATGLPYDRLRVARHLRNALAHGERVNRDALRRSLTLFRPHSDGQPASLPSFSAAQAVGTRWPPTPRWRRPTGLDDRLSDQRGFRWSDPADTRDPKDVLAGEGVEFDETGRALPGGRLTADDLHALLGWFDPDDDLPDEPLGEPIDGRA